MSWGLKTDGNGDALTDLCERSMKIRAVEVEMPFFWKKSAWGQNFISDNVQKEKQRQTSMLVFSGQVYQARKVWLKPSNSNP